MISGTKVMPKTKTESFVAMLGVRQWQLTKDYLLRVGGFRLPAAKETSLSCQKGAAPCFISRSADGHRRFARRKPLGTSAAGLRLYNKLALRAAICSRNRRFPPKAG